MSALTSGDEQALRHRLEVEWPELTVQQDTEGRLAMMTDDFVYMPPDHPVVAGKAEARAFLDGFPPVARLTQSLEMLTGSTELAVARGTSEGAFDVEGKRVSATGKWLCTVTKKDGDWVFTNTCFNWDAPPTEGA